VHHDRIGFSDPINGNPVALLNSEPMVGGLKLDPRPQAIVTKMNLRLSDSPCLDKV
jgi:hypothetical protein